ALMLSVGHDEYWSEEMRGRVEAFVRRGGNVAFFSGNICGYRIRFGDRDTTLTCAKVPPSGKDRGTRDVDHWADVRPENGLTGTGIRQAGGWWDGPRETLGYTVQHASHWVFEETGLKDGDVFGADPGFPLVGYEADGATFTRKAGLAVPTGEQGSPPTFFILGVAELGEGWVRSGPHAAATMGVYTSDRGGIVFNAATTDWPRLLDRSAPVDRITRNVLDRLRLPAVPILGPLPTLGGRMLAVAARPVRVHVDTAGLDPVADPHYRWTVAGATATPTDAATWEVRLPAGPDGPGPLTVTVTVADGSRPVAFGSLTLLPLSEE